MFIRTASERDLEAVRTLLVETWHATYDALHGAERVTEITNEWHSIAALKAKLDAPRSEFVVADDGKSLAGMAFALADETGETVTIRNLYVLPSQQGHGVGGMLMDEIEDSFPEAKAFRLEVEAANEKAVRFYAARGYVDAGDSSGPCTQAGVSATVREMVLRREA